MRAAGVRAVSQADVDFVVPDLFDTSGGIARIARAMSLALSRWADAHGATLTVHALMDQGGRHKLAYLPAPHRYVAYDGRRRALARALVAATWRAPRRQHAVVFAHPNLAVTALAFPPWVKSAVVAHGIDVWSPLRLERRLALRRVDELWPVSADTARHLESNQGVARHKIRVLANALDPQWPLPTDPRRGSQHVLAVSRLHPEHTYKGIDVTLEALARLPAERRPSFVVAGEGPDRPRLEAIAARLGLAVRFTGRVSDEVLAGLYRDASAFVLPSTGEGFGLVYLEAMAFALPCIAANAGGAPEVVSDGVTGIVVPPADVAAVARALEVVQGERGTTMGIAGRAILEERFLYGSYEARVHVALDALLGAVAQPALSRSADSSSS